MDDDFSAQLLEQAPDATVAISPDGEVLHWNRAAEKIFGFTSDEALGRLLYDLIVPPDKVEEEQRMQAQARERELAVLQVSAPAKGRLACACQRLDEGDSQGDRRTRLLPRG